MTQHTLLPAILSGGAGSRLWPLSRAMHPKQFQALVTDKPMLVETLLRLDGLEAACHVSAPLILGADAHANLIRGALLASENEDGQLLVEPSGKNTAPAAIAACLHAAAMSGPDTLVLLAPSDHHIGAPEAFRDVIKRALPLAAAGYLVTFGITPDGPETGYGYIKSGKEILAGYHVERFIEKPPLDAAKAMLAEGGYSWNAGIFLFRAGSFLEEAENCCPDMLSSVKAAYASHSVNNKVLHLGRDAWDKISGDSIDYAIMQKTEKAAILPVSMDWSDVGAFSSLAELAEKGETGNSLKGEGILVESKNCYVRSEGGRMVTLAGCEDLVVIDMPDALVILPKSKAQSVKHIVAHLKEFGPKSLL